MYTKDFNQENIALAITEFKSKIIGDGKRGPFYNGTQQWFFDVNDTSLFINAVWEGYLDASRTFSGIKGTDKGSGAFYNLAIAIQKYFQSKDEPFDHEKWCSDFIDKVRECYSFNARYGQAQKVVNMAFKYLYCCDGADVYRDKFEACHMPLDQYTLAWLFSEGEPLYQEWSWFDSDRYNSVSERIREILKTDILGKELVIWKEMQGRVVNLKELNAKGK